MTETSHETTAAATEPVRIDRAQFGLAGFLALLGGYTLYDASTLEVGFADPVGPRVFPYVIGSVLLLLAVLLVIATLRGSRPEADDGEDVDLDTPADWVTVGKLVGVLVFTIATITVLGWAISGALLFAGAAWALGSTTLVRDVLVGIVMSVASWYGFYVGLGIPLSPGLLDGIL
ncbi:MAG TPA: tripartite tricarboxylate transporter TctB family protein [Nocardioides sp.]|uniref:tripartite tricarboxylate transporter TctB family protein n=1 Tax=Nocardioides sp. TaxID=35761 RepID=UPI002BBA3875|nr:tripartite tricarboxylate transporter TctB family protein [Nocardioides sp.]HTW16576.1 tripartite tricarboxylate transporter TctB family protein [Nocardioides sp.]